MSLSIFIKNIRKAYPGQPDTLKGVDLHVESGEFVSIIGPSGCGKSTLLRIIAGLEDGDKGTVDVPGTVSMVFQGGALLPWLTVEENAAFGLTSKGKNKKHSLIEVASYLELVGLKDFAQKYPHELSGGQRQRVGIARALAVKPDVLLLDEPFSALDPKTTHELHVDLLKIWRERKLTVLMVSHLIEEAVSLSDRVILMKNGDIEEIFHIHLPYPRRENGLLFHEQVEKIRKKFFA
jgi:NitT/TauT family transport system ATP-binding protein